MAEGITKKRVVVKRWPKEDRGVFKYLSAEAMFRG